MKEIAPNGDARQNGSGARLAKSGDVGTTDDTSSWGGQSEAELFRRLADCQVPMTTLAAELDIRPLLASRQLAALIPGGSFVEVPGVPHDFGATLLEVGSMS